MSVEARIADLRRLVEDARAMPMSSSVVVNRSDVLARLRDLEVAVDEALAEARTVTAGRDEVVEEGRAAAQGLVDAARQEQERLASDTEVLRAAREQADAEVRQAQEAAQALREEADAYVDHKLAGFEVALERTLETVRRGRRRLADLEREAGSAAVAGTGGPGEDEPAPDSGFW